MAGEHSTLRFSDTMGGDGAFHRRHARNCVIQGRRQADLGELEAARVAFHRALRHDPCCVAAWRALAILELGAGAIAAAGVAIERAVALAPRDNETLFCLGNVRLTAGDPRGALDAYTRAAAVGEASPEMLFNRGVCLLMLDEAANAADAFQAVLDEQPTHARAWDGMGRARRMQHDRTAAYEAFLHALELDPGLLDTRDQLGHLLLEAGEVANALHVLIATAQIDPSRPTTRHLLGLARSAEGDHTAAASLWEGLIREGGADPDMYHLLATAYLHLRRLDDAIGILGALTDEWPTHIPGHLQLALLLLEYGDTDGGWRHLDQARAVDPNHPGLAQALLMARAIAPRTARARSVVR